MAKSDPFSIRLSDQHATDVADIMASTGWKKAHAIAHLLGLGIQTFRGPPTQNQHPHIAKPVASELSGNPGQLAPEPRNEKSGRAIVAAKQKPSRDRWNLKAAGVHFGPVKPELGSRLRGAKK